MPKKSATRRHRNDEALEMAAYRRSEHATVRRYLEALEARRNRRGRGVDPARLETRLAQVTEELLSAGPVQRLTLIQERMDLESRLGQVDAEQSGETIQELEEAFVAVAADWAARKGISYAALRAGGVPAGVLRRAGIGRAAG